MVKANKSVSLEQDMIYELEVEAREKGTSFSEVIQSYIHNIEKGEEKESDVIELFNTKYLILFNKLVLMENNIHHAFTQKIKLKEKELELLKQQEESFFEKQQQEYEDAISKIKKAGLTIKDVLEVDWEDGEDVLEFSMTKGRDKKGESIFKIGDMRTIKSYEEFKNGKGTKKRDKQNRLQ